MFSLLRVIGILPIGALFFNCAPIAPPSPLATFGGPKVVGKSQSETAIAIGSGAILFDSAHGTGLGGFVRYKYGISRTFDLGMDAIGYERNGKSGLTAKLAGRLQSSPRTRVEGGIGVADDSDGKSLNGDIGMTIGTDGNGPWNFYSSLRLGAAKGYPGKLIGTGEEAGADAWFPLANFGAAGRVSGNQRFVFEGGFGYVFPENIKPAPMFYLSAGLLFVIAGEAKR
ncbi:MAG TPA: hypothetical protein VJ385_00480 [Fibrobacteria bacterium]|nr:hypothetical protein [Fibrobacteria bacterium]